MKPQSAKQKGRICRRCKNDFISLENSKICDICKTKCSLCSVELTEITQDKTSFTHRKCYLCKQCVARRVRETRNKDNQKDYDLKRHYGLSFLEYKQMCINQDNKCAVCFEASNKLVVDHCHTTGKIRGLLCGHCNKGLGLFKDNPNILKSAAEYLK